MLRAVKTGLLAFVISTPFAVSHAEQKLTDQLSLSGLLEIDAYSLSQDAGGDSLDIIVSALEIGLDASINERLSVSTLLLYEDGFAGLEVDTAIMKLAFDSPFDLIAGQMVLPFGRYETAALSDPLTLELGETADTAVQLSTTRGSLSASITFFNGHNEEAAAVDDDQLRLILALDYSEDRFNAGFSWISNMDSDRFEELAGTSIAREVAGLGLYFIWRQGPLTLSAEHIMALDDYAAGDFGNDVGTPSQPSATVLELDYALDENSTLAVAFQHSSEAAFAGLSEDVLLAGYTRSLQNGLDIGLELRESRDYNAANGGAGNDTRQILFRMSAGF